MLLNILHRSSCGKFLLKEDTDHVITKLNVYRVLNNKKLFFC